MWLAALTTAFVLGGVAVAQEDESRSGSEQSEEKQASENQKKEGPADAGTDGKAEAGDSRGSDKARTSIAEAARRNRERQKVSPAIKAATRKTGEGDTKIVITNDVLERVFGPSSPPPNSPEYKELIAAGKKRGPNNARASGSPQGRSSASQKPAERAAEIRGEIDRLRKRILGMRNPYLPDGKATDEEREKEQGKDNAERVKMLEQKIERLEQELLAVQRKGGNR
jgi:hypothetical protein